MIWADCISLEKQTNSKISIADNELKKDIPGSSSGRTEDSGSSNSGSNPFPGVSFACKLKWDLFIFCL